jgi:hypothetical protein
MSMVAQILWDAAGAAGGGVSCAFTLMRRHMLASDNDGFHNAAPAVLASLAAQAIVTGSVAISLIVRAHHATEIEALLLMVSGVVSATLAFNLDRTGRTVEPAEEAKS